ncbi:putative RNA-directed DNA polymerase, eukaryota, reverse transcriptase zinc-binding domain protein [Tanacetum coccineum]
MLPLLCLETLMKFGLNVKDWVPHFVTEVQKSSMSLSPIPVSYGRSFGPLPHCLKTHSSDYGPIPFKFFNSWMLSGDFPTILSKSSVHTTVIHPAMHLKQKLQLLKSNIKMWRTSIVPNNDNLLADLKRKVELFDLKAKDYGLNDLDIEERLLALKQLEDVECLKRLDLMKKAKIKWAIKGDENLKLFHGIVNNKLSRSRINGLYIKDEIKEAAWNCGGSKAPGPDGFTFKFIKHYWDTIGKDFIDMVKWFQRDAFIPRGCDPLSPFLFIIAVEALHVTLQQAKPMNIFEGIKVGSTGVDVSHFQFVDDALIIGKWSHENAKNLYRILRCFELSSGLKVNFSKSKFFVLGASMAESNNLASSLGCQPSPLPCLYLGLLIGANMNKSCNWKPIIDKFQKCLTFWIAKTLSYGGRLTLSKSVLGSLGIYFFPLFKAPKRRGGLGIGSLQASNLAMLSKW